MSPSSEAVHTSRRISAATLLIVVAMLISAAVVFSARETIRPQPAAAESHTRVHGTHGKGYVIDGQWIGTWHTQDGTGFCIEFDKDHPDSTGAGQLGGRVPGMSTEDSERVKYVANHYGRTNSKVDGAAAAIFVWKTQDTRRFNSYYAKLLKTKKVSKAIRDRVAEIAAEAANHGPYKLTMTMGSGVVGQSDAGVVTVRTQKGKAVSRRAVVLTARSNGTLVRQDKTTDAKGRLAFSVKVTGTGAVRVDAKLVSPAPGGVLMTRPSAGHQRLVLAGKTMESASSTVSTQRSVNGPALSSACAADCAGAAPVTVSASNPCGAAVLREIVYVDGRALKSGEVDVTACRSVEKSFTIADGSVVTTRYCYLNTAKNCSGTPVANPGSVTVVGRALRGYRFAATCPCGADRAITYEVQSPAGSRRNYTVTLTVTAGNGSKWSRSMGLGNGWQALPTASLGKGSTATLTVTVLGKTKILDSVTEAA